MDKRILPKATKTKMIALLRAHGYAVPSPRQAVFSHQRHSYWLRWWDQVGTYRQAYYTAAGGRPVLQVDQTWVRLTMVEVVQLGLYEEQ